MPGNQPIVWVGETQTSQPNMPVILAETQSTVHSDINGVASAALTTAAMLGNIAVLGSATAGNSSVAYEAQQLGP
jgi:hypothetical protein